MKLSKLFNETKWGWAARGEEPPAAKQKPKISPEEQQRIRDDRLKAKQLRKAYRYWMPETDIASELLQKQAKLRQKQANARRDERKAFSKFFPED